MTDTLSETAQELIAKSIQSCFSDGKFNPSCYSDIVSFAHGAGTEVLKELPSSRLKTRLETIESQIFTELETRCGPTNFQGSTPSQFGTYLWTCLKSSPRVTAVKNELILVGVRTVGPQIDQYLNLLFLIFAVTFLVVFLIMIFITRN